MWEHLAHVVEDEYGGYVDWDERFFTCPHCGEPVYEGDWRASDYLELFFVMRPDQYTNYYCPICAELLEGEEDDE